MKHFRSFQNVPIVGDADRPPTKDEMAADLAAEMCERIKALRAEALAAEANAEPSMADCPERKEAYETLEALLKGRHRWVVVPVVLEHLPELVRPATDEEKAAVERYLADQAKAAESPTAHIRDVIEDLERSAK